VNLWECEHPGCTSTAVGCGGAAGLLAIGWYFVPGDGHRGPTLYCPAHRPLPSPCMEQGPNHGKPCALCPSELLAQHWQNRINDHHGWPKPPPFPYNFGDTRTVH
jgi:hypothetical protein